MCAVTHSAPQTPCSGGGSNEHICQSLLSIGPLLSLNDMCLPAQHFLHLKRLHQDSVSAFAAILRILNSSRRNLGIWTRSCRSASQNDDAASCILTDMGQVCTSHWRAATAEARPATLPLPTRWPHAVPCVQLSPALDCLSAGFELDACAQWQLFSQ